MKILLLLVLISPMTLAQASSREDQRLMLKKWGLAYCLRTYQQQGPENEASIAMGGYFQLGGHYENAYENVRGFFKRKIPEDTKVIKESGKANNLMRCLDAYESSAYSKLVLEQDDWLH